MVQVQQRVLIGAAVAGLLLGPAILDARRFYPDDPIARVPPPISLKDVTLRDFEEYYDFFYNTFGKPAEPKPGKLVPAQGVNTMGEVPDSAWYTNRHARGRMSIDELVRGPGERNDPASALPWKVTGAKTQGITPGLRIQDSRGRRFLLKFDPIGAPELQSAADVIGSKFFYAFGYNVPENHVVHFRREDLVLDPKAKLTDRKGRERLMKAGDISDILNRVPREKNGTYRGLTSLFLAGKPVGPFRYDGTRSDDPNDIVAHENRRDLRGLYVFASWLNHTDTKSINSLDTFVEEGETKFIRHHLIDFGAILGSDSFEPKSPRAGNVYLFDWNSSAAQFLTLGLYVPRWAMADYPNIRGVGRFESRVFDPENWKNNYYNPAFVNCLPDDAFWAAKQIMTFTEPEIHALVQTGRYSEPQAVEYLTRTLVERQQKIGRAWFKRVLPLDNIRVENGQLAFDDLAVKYGFSPRRQYSVAWYRFDNDSEQRQPLPGAQGMSLPPARDAYLAAEIRSLDDAQKTVLVYLRQNAGAWQPVGLERTW